MAGTYELWLTTDKGVRLQSLDDFVELYATRVSNGVGRLFLKMPAYFDESLLKPDYMVQVWRAPSGGRLSLYRPYFLRWWRFRTEGSEEFVAMRGFDPNYVLTSRIVAHYAYSSNAWKEDLADDMMKEIVTEGFADGSNPSVTYGTRVLSDFSIADDLGDGPSISEQFAWRDILTESGAGVLPGLAASASEEGTEVFFDVAVKTISSSSIDFQFRTYTGQPGMDISDRMSFSKEDGNLLNPSLEYDYSKEATYVYAGGAGQEEERNIQQVYDADRIGRSQWNRREAFQSATDLKTDGAIADRGNKRLKEGEPIIRVSGHFKDVAGSVFGRHWNWGDRVRVKYRSIEFDTIVRSTVLQVQNGKEEVIARFDYEQ